MAAPKGNKFAEGNSGPPPSKYTREFIEKEAVAFIEWSRNPDNLYFKRFALERDYPPEVLSQFAEKNEVFAQAYRLSKAWQECKIVEGALLNKLNSNFAKFAMTNIAGWTDKQQISGNAANPLAFLLQKADGQSKELTNGNN